MNDGIFAEILARLLDAGLVAIGPIVALHFGEHLFQAVKPADFGDVPLVRRLAAASGASFAAAALWRNFPVAPDGGLLAPFGSDRADFEAFKTFLMRAGEGLAPQGVFGTGEGPDLLYRAGLALIIAATAAAVYFWRGGTGVKAVLAALLTALFTGAAILYVTTALMWFIQLLNVWFIALAGLFIQKYRNLQSNHGA